MNEVPWATLFNTVAAVSGFYRDSARPVSPVATMLMLGLVGANMLVLPRLKASERQKACIRAVIVCLFAGLCLIMGRPPMVLAGLFVLFGLRELLMQ